MPNPSNPQDLNRYSYVSNNPMRYIDPTGHTVACNPMEGDCHHDSPTSSSGTANGNNHHGHHRHGGDDDSDPNPNCVNCESAESETGNPLAIILEQLGDLSLQIEQQGGCPDLWNDHLCLDYYSMVSQDVGTLASLAGALTTSGTTIMGCAGGFEAGVLAGCAAGYGFGVAAHQQIFNYVESGLSFVSFVATVRSDIVTKDTSFEPGNFSIGEDTKTGFITFAAGTVIVEPFVDSGIDIYASGYNHGFFSGISTLLSWPP